MRVGTIPEGSPLNSSSELFRLEVAGSVFLPEISTDSLVVFGCHFKRLERKFASQSLPNISLAVLPSLQKVAVIGRIGKDGDPFVILGSGPEKGNPSNVDFLDRVCKSASRFCNGFGERIEVANHDRDERNRLGFEISFVSRDRPCQDTWSIFLRVRKLEQGGSRCAAYRHARQGEGFSPSPPTSRELS